MHRTLQLAKRAGTAVLLVAAAGAALAQSFVPHRLLVKFNEGTPSARAAQVLSLVGARLNGELPRIGVKVISLPPQVNEQGAANAMMHSPNVEFAEPDWISRPASLPNEDRKSVV